MISSLSKKITTCLFRQDIILQKEKELYEYCFEILLSTVFNFLLLVLIGVLFHVLVPILMFAAIFIAVRLFSGGYHADTHRSCFLILGAVSLAFTGFVSLTPHNMLALLTYINTLISAVIIIFIAPVENQNRPFTEKERNGKKKSSRILALLLSVLIPVSLIFSMVYAFSLSLGMFSAALSLVAAWGQERFRRN